WNDAIFGVASTGATITRNTNGTTTVTYSGSTYTFTNVELVQFTDKPLALRTRAPDDFAASNSSDALWRNNATGAWGWSDIHNNLARHDLGGSSTAYNAVGPGDFAGQGASDALWRNNATGAWGWSDFNNNLAWHDLGGSLTAYSVVGLGDLNGDGAS